MAVFFPVSGKFSGQSHTEHIWLDTPLSQCWRIGFLGGRGWGLSMRPLKQGWLHLCRAARSEAAGGLRARWVFHLSFCADFGKVWSRSVRRTFPWFLRLWSAAADPPVKPNTANVQPCIRRSTENSLRDTNRRPYLRSSCKKKKQKKKERQKCLKANGAAPNMCTLDTSQDLSCDLEEHPNLTQVWQSWDGGGCEEWAHCPETLLHPPPPTTNFKGRVEVMLAAWLPDRRPEHFHNVGLKPAPLISEDSLAYVLVQLRI